MNADGPADTGRWEQEPEFCGTLEGHRGKYMKCRTAGVPRRNEREQKSHVDQEGKKACLIISLNTTAQKCHAEYKEDV